MIPDELIRNIMTDYKTRRDYFVICDGCNRRINIGDRVITWDDKIIHDKRSCLLEALGATEFTAGEEG